MTREELDTMMNETNYTYSDSQISELHEGAVGVTPVLAFWRKWKVMTPDQKQAEWDRLVWKMSWKAKLLAARAKWFEQGCKVKDEAVDLNVDGN